MPSSSWTQPRGAATADFDALVKNPAVSGLAIRVFWSALQPAKDRYDFSRLDAAFASADAAHKTVQLILVPGFGTPAWVLSELSSCDDLLPALTDAGGRAGGAKGSRAGDARGGRAGTRGDRAGAARGGVGAGAAGGSSQRGATLREGLIRRVGGPGPRTDTRAAAAMESRLQELLESLSHRSRRTVRDARRLRLDRRRGTDRRIGGDHSAARRRSARTLGTTPPTLLP